MSKTLSIDLLKFFVFLQQGYPILMSARTISFSLCCCVLFFNMYGNRLCAQGDHFSSTSVGVNRVDFWHELTYSQKWERWEAQVGFGYGINRTIFQGRFFPRLTVGGSYYLVHRERFWLGPTVLYGYNRLKYSKADAARVAWHDWSGGLKWSVGNRWRFGQIIATGYYMERYYSTLYDRKMNAGNWNYYTCFFVSYAL